MPHEKYRVLISNDDGVSAPGLRALAAELKKEAEFIEFAVVGPLGERSAQSHCITIGKHLHAFEIEVDGAVEAFAVDGTPADSTMIALNGPILQNPRFDLVVSGINHGDNAGHHVIYSGTVGAAREAACKGLPAIAFSLDGWAARSESQYQPAAVYAVSIIKAVLGLLPSQQHASSPPSRPLRSFAGHVINVNCPAGDIEEIKGIYLATQGTHCSFPSFKEVDNDPHFVSKNKHEHAVQASNLHMGNVTLRAYRNAAHYLQEDLSPGCDSWALTKKYVSLSVLALRTDVPLTAAAANERLNHGMVEAVHQVVTKAAEHLGTEAGGLA